MFSIPKIGETLTQMAKKYGVNVTLKHNLVEVTKNKAIF